VTLPANFDVEWTLSFLRARVVPGLESLQENQYTRVLRFGNIDNLVQLQFEDQVLEIEYSGEVSCAQMRRHIRWLFDLDAPLDDFIEMSHRDSILQLIVPHRPNIRLVRISDLFEGLVRAIIGQQISLSAANTILGRFVARYGVSSPFSAVVSCVFPSPTATLNTSVSELQTLGIQAGKAKALLACAEYCSIHFALFSASGERCLVISEKELLALPGIGPWSAGYVVMRCSNDWNGFPSNDLGVLKALHRLNGQIDAASIQLIVGRWQPWRSYATLHLWRSLDVHTRGYA